MNNWERTALGGRAGGGERKREKKTHGGGERKSGSTLMSRGGIIIFQGGECSRVRKHSEDNLPRRGGKSGSWKPLTLFILDVGRFGVGEGGSAEEREGFFYKKGAG